MLFDVSACTVGQIRTILAMAARRSTGERRRRHYFYIKQFRVRAKEIGKFKLKFVEQPTH